MCVCECVCVPYLPLVAMAPGSQTKTMELQDQDGPVARLTSDPDPQSTANLSPRFQKLVKGICYMCIRVCIDIA